MIVDPPSTMCPSRRFTYVARRMRRVDAVVEVEASFLDRDDGVADASGCAMPAGHAVFDRVELGRRVVGPIHERRLRQLASRVLLEVHATRGKQHSTGDRDGRQETGGSSRRAYPGPRTGSGGAAGSIRAMTADAMTTLASGSVDLMHEGGLEEKLATGQALRVARRRCQGKPDLTLGHAVVLNKMRQFQDAGHVAVLIVGDFTGRIGDPSGAIGDPADARRGRDPIERGDLPRAGGR